MIQAIVGLCRRSIRIRIIFDKKRIECFFELFASKNFVILKTLDRFSFMPKIEAVEFFAWNLRKQRKKSPCEAPPLLKGGHP